MTSFWRTKKVPTAEEEAKLIEKMRGLVPEEVHHKLLKGGEEGVNDCTLKRFLRSMDWDVEAAAKRLASHAEWRVNFFPTGRVSADEIVKKDFEEKKAYIQGTDKQGRAILYALPKNHFYWERDWSEMERFVSFCMDTALALNDPAKNPDGKVVVIYDVGGMSYKNIDRQSTKTIIRTVQEHYPERLAHLWLLNPSMVLYGFWQILSPFIDKATKEKIKFVYGKEALKEFTEHIDPADLPEAAGGTGKLKPVEEVAAALLENKLTKPEY